MTKGSIAVEAVSLCFVPFKNNKPLLIFMNEVRHILTRNEAMGPATASGGGHDCAYSLIFGKNYDAMHEC